MKHSNQPTYIFIMFMYIKKLHEKVDIFFQFIVAKNNNLILFPF